MHSPQSAPDAPDADLVRRAQAGERRAFAEIYRRYHTVVYRFARMMSGSPTIAEDVTQEVFVVLMRDLHRYRAIDTAGDIRERDFRIRGRTMKRRALMLVVTGMLAGAIDTAAQDQDGIFFSAAPQDSAAGQVRGAVAGLRFEAPVDIIGVEPLDAGEPVTGAPYSADVTTEIVQPLADGNRIERRSTTSIARDRQGRVRREQQLAAIGPILPQSDGRLVTITDPVARVHYSLDLTRKIATQLPLPFTKRIEAPPVGAAAAGERHAVLHQEIGDREVHGMLHQEIHSPKMEFRSEPLGTREIEGVQAEGTRTTTTIPAGAIGNVAATDIVSERWYSPDLQIVVLSRRTDPRFGDTTYRLENIIRGEPAAELFKVPADFTIETGPPFGARRIQPAPAR